MCMAFNSLRVVMRLTDVKIQIFHFIFQFFFSHLWTRVRVRVRVRVGVRVEVVKGLGFLQVVKNYKVPTDFLNFSLNLKL